jgi:hypothetical protein
MYFYKKFNKKYLKRFNRNFYKHKNMEEEVYIYNMLKKKFLPICGRALYEKFKKKIFLNFLFKIKNGRKFSRNFYKLNSLIYKLNLSKKKITKKIFIKKKKNIINYRIKKKLKTFYYIPDLTKTRQRVYSRFKKSVIYKFRKRKYRKENNIYAGGKFNLITYNSRNRYRNKMRMLELKKKSTPKFFFLKKKKNNYMKFRFNRLQTKFKNLPYFIIKKYRLKIKAKKYFKIKYYDLLKNFGQLKKKTVKKYFKDWKLLYNKSTYGNKFVKFNNKLRFINNTCDRNLILNFNKRYRKLLIKYNVKRIKLIDYVNSINNA